MAAYEHLSNKQLYSTVKRLMTQRNTLDSAYGAIVSPNPDHPMYSGASGQDKWMEFGRHAKRLTARQTAVHDEIHNRKQAGTWDIE